MDMISHKAKAIDLDFEIGFPLTQSLQIETVVRRMGEDTRAIVSTLDNVMWNIRYEDAC
jgi:hypothetical protein